MLTDAQGLQDAAVVRMLGKGLSAHACVKILKSPNWLREGGQDSGLAKMTQTKIFYFFISTSGEGVQSIFSSESQARRMCSHDMDI